ncbi:glycosyltransferase family 32 protein [Phenylobacterium ferrooxidans]|uniref:Glycosyltransferase n=1 Tax=Phenylobacterium ferrooxidans TaxID=2982689 RepID=A0ABW6CLT1_9CAUL
MSIELSLEAEGFSAGFHEDDQLRSRFMRRLILHDGSAAQTQSTGWCTIPKVLVRFWHDAETLPADVRGCLQSWEVLEKDGFEIALYNDVSATAFISQTYGLEHAAAFAQCGHPAMRSDYFRLCYVLALGGFYVDADDVVTEGLWPLLYGDDRLKLQPLCYDVPSGTMVEGAELWDNDAPEAGRIYYVNNNPLVAPPGHPVLRRALERATAALLNSSSRRDIQSITGPGNLTAVLAAHAHELALAGHIHDFALLRCWDRIARTKWDLSYRADERNWRNVDWG